MSSVRLPAHLTILLDIFYISLAEGLYVRFDYPKMEHLDLHYVAEKND